MAKLVSALSIGLIFGLGIALSGMANPAKVLNFFDLAGQWDPSLIFVMGGALGVAAIGYRLVFRSVRKPVFGNDFAVPRSRGLDWPLVAGSALFGVGWGIAGFCPGGAVPALGLGEPQAFVFVGSMIAGIVAARTMRTRFAALRPA
jgi:uncharacterized protein